MDDPRWCALAGSADAVWCLELGVSPVAELARGHGERSPAGWPAEGAKGVFEPLFAALSGEPDFEHIMVHGTIVREHQHATGAKRGTSGQAIGPSRGGLTTKIVALVDALGTLVRFILLPGQRHDSVGVAPLIDGITFDALLGDKGFDNGPLP